MNIADNFTIAEGTSFALITTIPKYIYKNTAVTADLYFNSQWSLFQ